METKFDVVPKSNGNDPLPFDLVKLPSKGKLYDEDHPFHNCETVDLKAMTAYEENILSTPALLKKGTVLNVLIKSCLSNKLVDPSSLLIGDKTALLLAIRISGFTGEYKAKVQCSDCSKNFENTFDLNRVELKFLEAEPAVPNKNLFSFKLPKSGLEVQFSLLTDADDTDITKTQENRKKAIGGQGGEIVDTSITDRLIKSIKKIGNISDPEQMAKFIKTMPSQDSRALRQYIKKIEPDVIMKQSTECPHCSAVEVQTIPMGLNFFWPEWAE